MTKPYIASLALTNFQSHASTIVALAPSGEMTIITGASDSGKTSIIRALRWLAYNTPSGSDFIRVGTEFARVVATMSDGTTIVRERRAKGPNQYHITRGNDCQTYEGFGANPPLEVQQALQMAPVAVGDMTINLNLSEQLDGPFLGKSISAGARAKTLGRIAGAEVIDQAGRGAGTDVGRRKAELGTLQGELAKTAADIAQYAWLDPATRGLEAAQEAHAEALRLEGVRDRLAGLKARLEAQREAQARTERALDRLQWVGRVEAAVPLVVAWGAERTRLDGCASKIAHNAAAVVGTRQDIIKIDQVLAIEPCATALSELHARRCRAAVLRSANQRAAEGTRAAEAILARWARLLEATDCTALAADLLPKASRLRTNQFQWAEARSRGLVAQQTATRLAGLEGAAAHLTGAMRARVGLAALYAKRTTLSLNSRARTEAAVRVHSATKAAIDAQTALAELLASLGTCPTCGQSMTSFLEVV